MGTVFLLHWPRGMACGGCVWSTGRGHGLNASELLPVLWIAWPSALRKLVLKNKSPERIAFLLCRVFKSDIRKQILLHLWILFLGEVLTTKKIRSSSIALGSAGIHQEVQGCLNEAACLQDSDPPQAAEGRSSDLLKWSYCLSSQILHLIRGSLLSALHGLYGISSTLGTVWLGMPDHVVSCFLVY